MDTDSTSKTPKQLSRWVSIGAVLAALALGLVVLYHTNHSPRTDDAEILANFIGIAPQVAGPIVRLNVRDNQFVKKGDLLFEIDERPYQYALERAFSEQAHADVAHAEQGVSRAKAEWTYASNNLHRLEPLLAKQFVTVDQVDRARTSEIAQAEALKQAESQLLLSQAELKSALALYERSGAALDESKAQHEQSRNAVTTLEPLINQRGARTSAVKDAHYNLDNCRVYAPFDARVTNLTISEGAYAHVGEQIFTLIDARTWWAIGNFREGLLSHIKPGMRADVYVLSKPSVRFSGVVDSVGFGVTPDPDRIGRLGPGLPQVERSLNWVHLASRYPVRVRVENPAPDLFRIGESAVVTIRGN